MTIVSIITVCRNAAHCIDQCIRSVVGQSYGRIEYIIVDGASDDGTVEVVNRYRERVAIFVSEPDNGPYSAMNKGIALASGDFILFINADDFLVHQHVIRDVVDFIESHPRGDVYYGAMAIRFKDDDDIVYDPGPPDKVAEMSVDGCLPHQTTFARRQVFQRTGLFDERYRIHADYDWFLKVIADPEVELVKMGLVVSSFWAGGLSSQLEAAQREIYRIQNAAPLYQTLEWSRRRIEILQHSLLAHKFAVQHLKKALRAKVGIEIERLLKRGDRQSL